MQEHLKQEPKSLQKALEQKEQLEARIANERSKYAADLRTAQSRHKHMIGGAVVKYFPGVYHFDEAEVNEIIMAALATRECLKRCSSSDSAHLKLASVRRAQAAIRRPAPRSRSRLPRLRSSRQAKR